jgi:adenylate cyclase
MAAPQILTGGEAGKGSLLQQVRLWTGLVLFAYVLWHYINHSLGHISIEAMERMLDWQEAVTGNPFGIAILYGALIVHAVLGIWRLVNIKTWRKPTWEWAQILLGLAIPWFLISHITFTRGAQTLIGIEVDYHHELLLLWPGAAVTQSILMLVVWAHAVVGLHFWLRLRRWYPAWFPLLAGLALAIPAIAFTGWIAAARRLLERMQILADQSEEGRAAYDNLIASNQFIGDNLRAIESGLQWIAVAIVVIVIAIMVARWSLQRFGDRVHVNYGGGLTVTSPPGHTILEISRAWGIPHMSVCGGRARCSTCRTQVLSGLENLTPPNDAEAALLRKIDADDKIRLACQSRVMGDVELRPMIPASTGTIMPRRADPIGWGVEKELAVMFLDVRGFSRLSEHTLPYDVVYILNSLFEEVGNAIEKSNGYIDKFMGDGVMAFFGLATAPRPACRDALRAALDAHDAAERASRKLSQHLSEPMRIGVGIHFGQAVIGRVGKTSDQLEPSRLTAIGDTVNVAARLEAATKEFSCGLVVSSRLVESSGIEVGEEIGLKTVITVHNISAPVEIVAIRDLQKLREQLDRQADSETVTGKSGEKGIFAIARRRSRSGKESGEKPPKQHRKNRNKKKNDGEGFSAEV